MSRDTIWQAARPDYGEVFERAHHARSIALRSLVRFVRQRLRAWLRHRRRIAALRELHALDDRLLADIGLSRATIRETVEGLFENRR